MNNKKLIEGMKETILREVIYHINVDNMNHDQEDKLRSIVTDLRNNYNTLLYTLLEDRKRIKPLIITLDGVLAEIAYRAHDKDNKDSEHYLMTLNKYNKKNDYKAV